MDADTQLIRLKQQNKTYKAENAELKETLRAIQSGEVDALVVAGPSGERIFTLQSVEQPYRELVEAMNEGAITVSPDGIILYSNARFEAMIRVPHGKLVGSSFRAHIRAEDQMTVQALLERSRFCPSSAETSLHVTEQISLPVQLSVSAIQLVGKKGFCIIATDLSAQKQSTMLAQQQEWLGTVLSLLPVPLVLLASDLKSITFINAKATEVLEGADFKGRIHPLAPMALTFENEDGAIIAIHELLEKMDRGERSLGIETILMTRTRKIPVLLFSETLPAIHGRESARLLMFQDISIIKQAQLDLSTALRGRDQFMAALSHELRTPINVVLGWVKVLRAGLSDEATVKQALDTLDRNAELQRDLIENLLDMSRIITGSLNLQLQPIDLKNSLRECLNSLQLKATEKGIEVQVDFIDETTTVPADDKRLQQLISNLVQNAIKFTPSHGKIIVRVRTDPASNTASFSVQDNGRGIDPGFLPFIFDQFKQENMSTSRTFGGLGLGLTICKTIVEQHHGEIKALSEGVGKGSRFIVHLPLSNAMENVALQQTKPKPAPCDLTGIRVLLVDDALDNLVLFSFWLKKGGATVKTLESAENVIETIAAFKPHVLVSDISMPGEDGYALIAKVRALCVEKGGHIPAAALTANARGEDRKQTLAAGFNLHIAKPVSSAGLLESVRALVEIGRLVGHEALSQ